MTITAFDSDIFGPLYSDAEMAALFTDDAHVAAMVGFESALARVQGRLDVIPAAAAEAISQCLESITLDPMAVAEGTLSAGIPVPALVALLQAEVPSPHNGYLHWGATSQDVIDSALVLRLKQAGRLMEQRLAQAITRLSSLADKHRATVLAGRTRSQQATPTTLGLKAATWLSMLVRHRQRMTEISPRLFVLSLGGASGTLSVLGQKAEPVETALATELGLGVSSAPWHTARDVIVEYAGLLSLISGSLGKIGRDIILMSQSEVGEVTPGSTGGSSTMPNKANPVAAEILLAIARYNAGQVAVMHQALIHEQERSGSAWQLEWMTLPQMVTTTGRALLLADDLLGNLKVNSARMRANIDAGFGLVYAEAASFALAAFMPRPEAQALVKKASKKALSEGRPLVDILRAEIDHPIDWDALTTGEAATGMANLFIDRVLAEV